MPEKMVANFMPNKKLKVSLKGSICGFFTTQRLKGIIVGVKKSSFWQFTSFSEHTNYGYYIPMDVCFLKMPGDKLGNLRNMIS